MKRMDNGLVGRVTQALYTTGRGPAYECKVMALTVLRTLGLDDLDAAVERGARRLVWEQHQGCVRWEDTADTATSGDAQTRGYALLHVRAVLEAALTATEGPHDG